MSISIDGLKKSEAMTLLIQGGMDFVEAEKYWKENGGAKRTGFRAMFYAELQERDMSAEEVKEYCRVHGSANDFKAYTHYVTIAELVASVRG